MRREQRLTTRAQYAQLYEKGRSCLNALLVLRTLPNGLTFNRYGFVVSRRVGKAAVRNRLRRRLREAVRTIPTRPGWDMVFIARDAAAGAGYWQLKAAMEELLQRAGLQRVGEAEVGSGMKGER